jgi:hypothetical protein
VRHKSGRYYARTFGNNKEIWKSLHTNHISVARARLAEFLREHREKQTAVANHSSAKMTFAEALAIHLQNLEDNVTIKPTTPLLEAAVYLAAQELAGIGGTGSAQDNENRLHRMGAQIPQSGILNALQQHACGPAARVGCG